MYLKTPEDQKLIESYKSAPSELMQAIAGLNESDLNQTRAPGTWSIREIVHHIVDCDMNYVQFNRYALADTGKTYFFNEFNGDSWNFKMDYKNRSIESELKLFTMMREYIAYLCIILNDSLDRVLVHEHGKATVRDALRHDTQHVLHHIEQILETRRINNI
ncbi:DinB family protein [Sporosarcina sp. USHLN248]|uniref:DinB family protein n=1 Tax=Sporosarcina sp. USHLN248 TaxID=3081300 RepID=UPI00301AB040